MSQLPGGMEGVLAFAHSAAIAGIDAYVVRVESDSAAGTPTFHIVGLPDRALNESRDRVRSAIVNSGFGFPPGQLLVNLAPADLQICASRASDSNGSRAHAPRNRRADRPGGHGAPAFHIVALGGRYLDDASTRCVVSILGENPCAQTSSARDNLRRNLESLVPSR